MALTLLSSIALCVGAATVAQAAPDQGGFPTRNASAGLAGAADIGPARNSSDEVGDASLQWMITAKALAMISDQPGVRDVLDSPSTLVVNGPGSAIPQGWTPSAVISFTSYEKLHSVLSKKNGVAPGVRGVIYDSEHWAYTPLEEQQNPGWYTALAAIDAHARGLTLIAMPATTLVQVIAPGTGNVYQRFLDAGIIADSARTADTILIQAQGSLPFSPFYAKFVRDATAQARAANPLVVVLAGLSTNPAGRAVTLDHLIEAVRLTRAVVDGYSLNIPDQGPFCSQCNPSRPDLAVALLQDPIIGPPATP